MKNENNEICKNVKELSKNFFQNWNPLLGEKSGWKISEISKDFFQDFLKFLGFFKIFQKFYESVCDF